LEIESIEKEGFMELKGGSMPQPGEETEYLPKGPAVSLQGLVEQQLQRLFEVQLPGGEFLFELEADCTIPAEYILLGHFIGTPDSAREPKIAVYVRRHQNPDGSWPLFHGGEGEISATVKAYWALKLAGDSVDAPHMIRAREWILERGGAACANVFTRYMLALFGQIPWRGVPAMPVEIVLLPRWFPFDLYKVSYWSRTVVAPLLILFAMRARAENPTGIDVQELFVTPPERHRQYNTNPTGSRIGNVFLGLDKILHVVEPRVPSALRRRAIERCKDFFVERLNGEDGLGAIYPAMANAVMALHTLGYPHDHPLSVTARRAIELMIVEREDESYCQPCLSPIWDTALAAHAILEAGDRNDPHLKRALDWMKSRQILNVAGDWAVSRPGVRPGGWAFQYWNDYYPDVDDTAVVAAAMHRQGDPAYRQAIDRACEWLVGMQSSTGGWGAFDPENEYYYLNSIPFADHGALLDPPTVDVTARCVSCLAQVDANTYAEPIARAVAYLKRHQEPDGSWFGRWGANYVYGTWSALCALNAAGEDMSQPYIRRSVEWLKQRQCKDGGWGEDLATYWDHRRTECKSSTPSQTAWAMLALMAAGEVHSREVAQGARYLEHTGCEGPRWREEYWTGVGFPRVFYLKYHGYAAYFPLWALARYQRLRSANDRRVAWGL